MPWAIPKARSSRSFAVRPAAVTVAVGRLIPLCEERAAPATTRQRMSVAPTSSATSSISPSQSSTRSPGRTLRGRSGQLTDTSRASPGTARVVSVKGAPAASRTGPAAISPMRILSPARSWRTAIGAALSRGQAAQSGDDGGVLGMRSVREVEPGDVHAGVDQALEGLRRGGGRSDRADDLGARHPDPKSTAAGDSPREAGRPHGKTRFPRAENDCARQGGGRSEEIRGRVISRNESSGSP